MKRSVWEKGNFSMNIKTVTNNQEKSDAFLIRRVVFINEQQVPEELEIDELDKTAIHFIGYEDHEPVAAARMRFADDYGKLERICVLKSHRGKSFGKQIIEFMEKVIEEKSLHQSKLNAQTHAIGFYQSLGYEAISEEFMDAGIPHVTMVKTL